MGAKKTSGRLPEVFIDRLRDNTLQGLGDLVGTGGLLHAAADALHAPHRLLRGHALQQGGHALEISIAAPLGLYRPDHAVLHLDGEFTGAHALGNIIKRHLLSPHDLAARAVFDSIPQAGKKLKLSPLPLQLQPVGDHGDEFAVGRLPLRV